MDTFNGHSLTEVRSVLTVSPVGIFHSLTVLKGFLDVLSCVFYFPVELPTYCSSEITHTQKESPVAELGKRKEIKRCFFLRLDLDSVASSVSHAGGPRGAWGFPKSHADEVKRCPPAQSPGCRMTV